jgi:hypothetical protein
MRARRGSCRRGAERVLPPYRRFMPAARFPPPWIIDGTFGLSSGEFFLCDADCAPDTAVANRLPFELTRYRLEECCVIRWS